MYQIDFQKPIHIHFIGIGGISMSGLAEILLDAGFYVSGSDSKHSALTDSLQQKGAVFYLGQSASHISPQIDVAVYTAAVHEDNPEYCAAKALHIPLMSRAELLGQMMKNYKTPIAISGTHGKTTTTSMVSEILLAADTDPTLSIGGILKSIHGNIRVGQSEYFVTEACEYTNSFLSFFPKISMILNVEEDHMDFFQDLEQIRSSFHRFAMLLPDDGLLIINGDIDNLEALTKGLSCRILTFGKSPSCDYFFNNICHNELGHVSFSYTCKNKQEETVFLTVPGEHNAYNALAAIVLADALQIPSETTRQALSSFHGTDRRFEYKGRLGGITIIDDYAHHPTEIEATLHAAAHYPHHQIWCVFQPHTYSRTKAFLPEFAKALSLADKIILTDIFAARETDTLGISSRDLQAEIERLGKECFYFSSFDAIENFLLENCINEDLLITMGAGDVLKIGEKLLGI